jgi:hypothetical protein
VRQSSTYVPPKENWELQKGRKTSSPQDIIACRNPGARRLLQPDLHIPEASKGQLQLLRFLIQILIEQLLAPYSLAEPTKPSTETSTCWGLHLKHSLDVTVAYPDGSALRDGSKAGFGVYFPELNKQPDFKGIASRIPGDPTIARAEAFGVLAALLLTKPDNPLDIYCDREPLVNCINRFKTRTPLSHEL